MLPTIQKQSEFDRIFAGDIQPVLKAPPQTALVHISSFLQDWGRFLAETTLVRWEKLSVEYTDYQLNYNQVWPTGVEFNSQIAEGYCCQFQATASYQLSLMRSPRDPKHSYLTIHRPITPPLVVKHFGGDPENGRSCILSISASELELRFTQPDKQNPNQDITRILRNQTTFPLLQEMFVIIQKRIAQQGFDPFNL
jgi:hypothetical protein